MSSQVTILVVLLLYICYCAKSSHKNVWPETAGLNGPGGKAGGLSLRKAQRSLVLGTCKPACQTRNSMFACHPRKYVIMKMPNYFITNSKELASGQIILLQLYTCFCRDAQASPEGAGSHCGVRTPWRPRDFPGIQHPSALH